MISIFYVEKSRNLALAVAGFLVILQKALLRIKIRAAPVHLGCIIPISHLS
jgi:hypothetical protein